MSNTAGSDKRIYLDHAAATPIDQDVLQKMLPYFHPKYGNPSSMHTSGRMAKQAILEARREVAYILNASLDEIIFTGSGTEADNLALFGAARANRAHGNHIIISAVEHKAVMEAAALLGKEGFKVSIVPVDKAGMVDVEKCLGLVTPQTTLVSVMYANNEIGTIQPIKELAAGLAGLRAGRAEFPLLHTDACQAAGALSLDVKELGIDLMSLNGSKIYGPKGIGVLYKKRGVQLQHHIVGGEQEMNLRAGTESLPLIMGFAEALKKSDSMRAEESNRLAGLRDYFINRLREEIPDIVLNGHSTKRLPNNVHISIPYIEGESMLLMLDNFGIEASTGSACSAFDLKPSHVLLALGQDAELVHGTLRFTLGRFTTQAEIDRVIEILPGIVERLKHISALTAKVTSNT